MIDGYIFFTKWEYRNLNAGIPIFFAPKPPILAGKTQAISLLTVIILINIPHKKISLTLLIPGLIVLPNRIIVPQILYGKVFGFSVRFVIADLFKNFKN